MARPKHSKAKQKKIAKKRTDELFKQAQAAKDEHYANRYITLARKIAMKVRLRLTSEQKIQFCKHCYKHLRPGINARVRIKRGKVITLCKECKKFRRIPLR